LCSQKKKKERKKNKPRKEGRKEERKRDRKKERKKEIPLYHFIITIGEKIFVKVTEFWGFK
jgi:hypothetical protein